MTGIQSSLENYFPCDWTDPVHSEHIPVSSSISSGQYFSPVAGLIPVHRPSKRRRALDHFSDRLKRCGLSGSDCTSSEHSAHNNSEFLLRLATFKPTSHLVNLSQHVALFFFDIINTPLGLDSTRECLLIHDQFMSNKV